MLLNFCETFLKQVRERQEIYKNRLCSGAFHDFEEYKFVAGILKGLSESEILMANLYKNIFELKKQSSEIEELKYSDKS